MNYAIIKIGNKQHLVRENDEIVVDKLNHKVGEQIKIKEILLNVSENNVSVGTPLVSGTVIGELKENIKGEKIRVSKYRSKSRYRKVKGHRQDHSIIKILSLDGKPKQTKKELTPTEEKVKTNPKTVKKSI